MLGTALGAAVHDAGWKIEARAGEPLVFRSGSQSLEPVGLLQEPAQTERVREGWEKRARAMDIAELPLIRKNALMQGVPDLSCKKLLDHLDKRGFDNALVRGH